MRIKQPLRDFTLPSAHDGEELGCIEHVPARLEPAFQEVLQHAESRHPRRFEIDD